MILAYYIYYRVDGRQTEAARARVSALQAALQERLGITGRVLKKRYESLLWMEVYEGVRDAAAFEQAIDELVEKVQFDEVLQLGSVRVAECFVIEE